MDLPRGEPSRPSGGPALADPPLEPVGVWVRFGAYAIDTLFLIALWTVFLRVSGGGLPSAGGARQLLIGAAVLAYHALLVGAGGATLGKLAAGAVVVRIDGSPVGYGRAAARTLSYLLSGAPVGLGFVAAAFTPGKRGLHDYLAGTRVVYAVRIGLLRKTAVAAAGVLLVGVYAVLKTLLAIAGSGGTAP